MVYRTQAQEAQHDVMRTAYIPDTLNGMSYALLAVCGLQCCEFAEHIGGCVSAGGPVSWDLSNFATQPCLLQPPAKLTR
jgi:hypothetical protein